MSDTSIAEELITRGWCKFRLEDAEGRVCLLGAALAAVHGNPMALGRIDREQEALDRVTPPGYLSAVAFNNALDTTYDDVLRVAKQADEILSA